jgi:vitamin B12 transporter
MRLLSWKSSCSVLALAAGPLAATSALAQQPIQLPGIYVQGATLAAPTQSPAKAAGPGASQEAPASTDVQDAETGVPIASVGNAVTVVTGEELRRQQARNGADALRSLPGVSVNRTGGFGSLTQVRIRGAEGNHTLVLIDGIQANSVTDGEFDFSNLSIEDIERIEVIRGPMSALYGSNAVGGVVNIITRKGSGPLSLTLRSEFGSLGTTDYAARLSAGNKWGHFSFGAHLRDTNGYNISPFGSEADALRLESFNFRGGLQITETLGVEAHLRQTEKHAARDAFGGAFGTLSTAVDDNGSQLHDKVWLGGVRVTWDTFNKTLTHQFRADRSETTITDKDLEFPPPAFITRNEGERTTYGYLGTYRFDTPALWGARHTISGLVESETEKFASTGDFSDHLQHQRERVSFATEWSATFADQVSVTAGVRRDDNDVFEDFTTWRLAGSWVVKPIGIRPHASIGTAVKFPTMFEQFGRSPAFPPFIANPNLLPEESLGWDAGVEFTLGRTTTLDVTYFHADLQNKISRSGLAAPDPTLINLPGTSTREGVEFALRTKLTPSLMATVAYTYLNAEESTGLQEIRRPRHSGRVDLAYDFAAGRGKANLGVIYNGSQMDSVFINNGFPQPFGRLLLDEYLVVNAAVSYKLQPGVELFGRVENLFDHSYQEVYGYQAAPIQAFAGLKLTFGGTDGIGSPGKK